MAKRETSFPPVKVAVLIDGGFFIKRFNALYNKDKQKTGEEVAEMLYTMAMKHVAAGTVDTSSRAKRLPFVPCWRLGRVRRLYVDDFTAHILHWKDI